MGNKIATISNTVVLLHFVVTEMFFVNLDKQTDKSSGKDLDC